MDKQFNSDDIGKTLFGFAQGYANGPAGKVPGPTHG
jgi:hypothetical protein